MYTLQHPVESYKKFNIDYNSITVKELITKYEEVGFIYPAKKKLLAPHFSKIVSNWETLKNSSLDLLWIMTSERNAEHFASISVFKQSNKGLLAQHLVSDGNPYLSLKVMLAAQYRAEHLYDAKQINSSQNWFRPNNRYAYRIFASMYKKLGSQRASLLQFHYLHQSLDNIKATKNTSYKIEEVNDKDQELIAFVQKHYGHVFVEAEELDQTDIQLQQLAEKYNSIGLKYSRQVLMLREIRSNEIVGVVIGNRAPLGLNFSYIENRAYIIADSTLDQQKTLEVLNQLLLAIKPHYDDFDLGTIPIVCDAGLSSSLEAMGAKYHRTYIQSIWLRSGFSEWYAHINSFLQRIESRNTTTIRPQAMLAHK